MTAARAIEYRIIRNQLSPARQAPELGLAQRLIAIVAGTGLLLLAGSLAPELLIIGVAAATLVAFI